MVETKYSGYREVNKLIRNGTLLQAHNIFSIFSLCWPVLAGLCDLCDGKRRSNFPLVVMSGPGRFTAQMSNLNQAWMASEI